MLRKCTGLKNFPYVPKYKTNKGCKYVLTNNDGCGLWIKLSHYMK